MTPPLPSSPATSTPSRDGRQIFAVGRQDRTELLRHDPESGRLSRFLSGISAEDVAFSSDGNDDVAVLYDDPGGDDTF